MSKVVSIRRRPRGLATEQAILQATLELLSADGYAELTIDRVAATARASKATIYRRWPTKEHLVLAVFDRLPIQEPPDTGDFEGDLRSMFGQYVRVMKRSPLQGVLPSLVAECVNNPALSEALFRVNEQRRAPLRQILNRAVARGELARELNVELTIDVIQGAIAIRQYFLLDKLTEGWIHELIRMVKKSGAPA